MKINASRTEKCFLLLVLVFGACFHLPFITFRCSSLLVLVFEIESVVSQKRKEANAFDFSFWFFVDVSISTSHACFGFLLV